MFPCIQHVNDLFLDTKVRLFSLISKYLDTSVSIQLGYMSICFADSSAKFACFLFHVEHCKKKNLSAMCMTFQIFFLSLHPKLRKIIYG